jgi:hypothetical protein
VGAKSLDGKARQAEGRDRYLRKLRGQGRKPGPAKGTGGRPRKDAISPVEQLRLDAMAAMSAPHREERRASMPVTPLSGEEIDARIDAAIARALSEQAACEVSAPDNLFAPSPGQTPPAAAAFTPAEKPPKPDLALITNPEPVSRTAPSGDLKVVYDADAGNTEVLRLAQDCGKLELERIKRRIERDPDGPSDAGDQRFIASALNTTTTASLRADEQRWRQHIADNLPEWLERVAEEERKLEARTIDGTLVDDGGDAA